MEVGWVVYNRGRIGQREHLVQLAQHAERLEFSSIWVTDHIVMPVEMRSRYPFSATGTFPTEPSEDYLEPLTVLSYLAACTRRVKLGVSALILPHRNPLVAAKTLATLDVLSSGRVLVGVAVGWLEEEFRALGLPPFAERGAYSEECLRIFKEVWTKDDPSFAGRYHSFTGIKFAPKPIQKPHPPIWVGGHSAAARRRAGQFGDAWHPVGQRPPVLLAPDELGQAMLTVREAAERAGRDPLSVTAALRITVKLAATAAPAGRFLLTGSPSQVADDIRRYGDVGVTHLVLDVMTSDPATIAETMDRFANEVRPRLGGD